MRSQNASRVDEDVLPPHLRREVDELALIRRVHRRVVPHDPAPRAASELVRLLRRGDDGLHDVVRDRRLDDGRERIADRQRAPRSRGPRRALGLHCALPARLARHREGNAKSPVLPVRKPAAAVVSVRTGFGHERPEVLRSARTGEAHQHRKRPALAAAGLGAELCVVDVRLLVARLRLREARHRLGLLRREHLRAGREREARRLAANRSRLLDEVSEREVVLSDTHLEPELRPVRQQRHDGHVHFDLNLGSLALRQGVCVAKAPLLRLAKLHALREVAVFGFKSELRPFRDGPSVIRCAPLRHAVLRPETEL